MDVRVRRKAGERKAFELRWAIRTSYPWNAPLSPEDDAFIRAALQNHPDVEEKTGVGIDFFVVDDDGQFNCCIWAVRLDGTREPISKDACLDRPNPFRQFSDACRTAVACDAVAAKNAAFADPSVLFGFHTTIICPALGLEVTYDQAHAHHAEPWTFLKIVKAFLEARPDIDQGRLASYVGRDPELVTRTKLTDKALADDFYRFHRERAVLVVVSATANLTNALKGPR